MGKTAMQQMIDCIRAHQTLCINNGKKTKDKVVKKQFESGATICTLLIMAAKDLLIKEEGQLKEKFSEGYNAKLEMKK
jgi:S-adenosylmethionine:tRNA-ribosyltransferase-isomerase (queuine synthetase)